MDKERRALVALLLVIVVAVAAEVFVSHSTPPSSTQPRAILGNLELLSTSVGPTSLGSDGLSLSLDAVIYNPNGFGATLKEANYSVYADGRFVGTGRSSNEYNLAPGSSLTIAFPVTVGLRGALEATRSYLLGLGHVTWTVDGTAIAEIGGLTLHVAFEFNA